MKLTSPRLLVGALILALAGGLGAGWIVANTFQSPQQVAAMSSAPPPSEIVAPVAFGDLGEQISIRATIQYAAEQSISISTTGASVVTSSPLSVGASVNGGDLIAEIDGTPVFAIQGAFPLYRDLHLGDHGPDVKLVQDALSQSGRDLDADGVLGNATIQAISELFNSHGYALPTEPAAVAPGNSQKPSPTVAPTDGAQEAQGAPAVQPYVPVQTFAVIPTLPGVVSAVPPVGRVAETGAAISVVSGAVHAVSSVTPETASKLSAGMSGEVVGQSGDSSISVLSVADSPDDRGTVEVLLVPGTIVSKDEIGSELVVRLRVSGSDTEGWIVPTRAVITRAGQSWIRVRQDDGSFLEVKIREIDSHLGMSQIETTSTDELSLDDQVLIQ